MSASKLALCALFCFVSLGCGDDDDGDSAPAKCDDLVADLCARAVECVGGGTEQECIADVKTAIPCGKADAVGETYNRCIDQVNMNSCASLVEESSGTPELLLPADCEEVILFE